MRARKLLSRPFIIAMAVAAVAATVSFSQLGGSAGASGTQDKITYNQTTGAKGTYIQYIPGDGSKVTNQSVTSGGGCATPSVSGVPLLGFAGRYYASGYSGAFTNVPAGAYKARTGVCSVPQAWSIEVNEGLVFSVGSNTLTTGREFSDAQIKLEREDKSVATDPPVVVQAVLRLGSTVVQTQTLNIAGPGGTQATLDTDNGFGFDSIELQVLSPAAGSISVVGPTSTFTFANEICPGQTITDTSTDGSASAGQVTASFTFVSSPGGACKSYTTFDASASDPTSSTLKSVQFLSQQLAGAHITAVFDWGLFPYCRPDNTPDPQHPDAPVCPTTQVDFGSGFVMQSFCAPNGATTTDPWCTTSKHFDYVPDPADSSVTEVHITETWDGLGDTYFKH
jgi:hypothetical protein